MTLGVVPECHVLIVLRGLDISSSFTPRDAAFWIHTCSFWGVGVRDQEMRELRACAGREGAANVEGPSRAENGPVEADGTHPTYGQLGGSGRNLWEHVGPSSSPTGVGAISSPSGAAEGLPTSSSPPQPPPPSTEAEARDPMVLAMQIEDCWSFGELRQLSRDVGLATFTKIHVSLALQVLATLLLLFFFITLKTRIE